MSVPDPSRSVAPAAASPLDRFEEFWRTYPRRTGKDAARRAWVNALKGSKKAHRPAADPELVIAAAAEYARDPNRVDKFTPHPATWLNQGRYADEQPTPGEGRSLAANRDRLARLAEGGTSSANRDRLARLAGSIPGTVHQ